MTDSLAAQRSPTAEVLRLAWPATLSFLLNNSYRINDQFWIKGLGADAQSAIGAMMYVAIMTFALYYFSAGGTLALVSRAEGAKDRGLRNSISRHAILLAITIGILVSIFGPMLVPTITAAMQLDGGIGVHAAAYLDAFFMMAPAMVIIIATDHIFIARGYTIVPMLLQLVAVSCNYFLNPILIYGVGSPEVMANYPNVPGLEAAMAVAAYFDIQGSGLHGAAMATGLSRLVASSLALILLHFVFDTPLNRWGKPVFSLLKKMAVIAAPVSWSIAVYAGVYWLLYAFVLSELDDAVKAALGIGFQVFDGVSFPVFLGIGLAGSSLVGRSLGANDPDQCLIWVRTVRRTGYAAGAIFTLVFIFAAPSVISIFTSDPAVADAARTYAFVIGLSQIFVAVECVNEKVLSGSGHTMPIAPITLIGNLIRLPIAYTMALTFGMGAAGVWWAINLSTAFKALAYRRVVQKREWLGPISKT
ncbi:MAG: putative MATE family efflux protein [Planctomycetota bacterium]